MKRSSNSRIWNEARTRIAISSSDWPSRCSCSISSPTCARLLLRIPDAGDGRLLAGLAVGEQRLAEPALVVGDECAAAPRIWPVER